MSLLPTVVVRYLRNFTLDVESERTEAVVATIAAFPALSNTEEVPPIISIVKFAVMAGDV